MDNIRLYKPIENLTKLFDEANINTAYKNNNNFLNIINATNKLEDTLKKRKWEF